MKSVKSLKSQAQGRDVYIIASGPSVNTLDLSCLVDESVILVNGAVRLFDKYRFSKPLFCTTDARFINGSTIEDFRSFFENSNGLNFFRADLKPLLPSWLRGSSCLVKPLGRDGFSNDLSIGFYYGCTSVMLALHIAFYMDARRCVLVGVDQNQILGVPRFYNESEPQPVDPFFSVQVWNIANAVIQFRKFGKSVVVVGENSLLRPYVPYQSFEECVFAREI